jgi:hypothetical protein
MKAIVEGGIDVQRGELTARTFSQCGPLLTTAM